MAKLPASAAGQRLASPWLAGAVYLAVGMASRAFGYHQIDAGWHAYSAQRILDGSLLIYSRLAEAWAAPPLGMPFTYPPLLPLLLAPVVAVGQAAGLAPRGVEVLIGLPVLVGDVLLAGLIARTAARWTRQADGRSWRTVAFLLALLTFAMPLSSAYMDHHESLSLWLIILALTAPSPAASGLFWGLALAGKQTALFGYLPCALLLLRDAWCCGRLRLAAPVRFFALSLGLPVLLTLPFWLAAPDQAAYALFGVESQRIIFGVNVPHILLALVGRILPSAGAPLEALLIRITSPAFLLLSLVSSLVFVARHPGLPAYGREGAGRAPLVAMMGANFAAFIVLGKWNEMHYQLVPLLLLLLLDLIERPRFPFVFVLFVLAAGLFYVYAEPISVYWRFAVYAALTLHFLTRAFRRPRSGDALSPPPAPA